MHIPKLRVYKDGLPLNGVVARDSFAWKRGRVVEKEVRGKRGKSVLKPGNLSFEAAQKTKVPKLEVIGLRILIIESVLTFWV